MSYLLNLPLEAIAVAAGFDKETYKVEDCAHLDADPADELTDALITKYLLVLDTTDQAIREAFEACDSKHQAANLSFLPTYIIYLSVYPSSSPYSTPTSSPFPTQVIEGRLFCARGVASSIRLLIRTFFRVCAARERDACGDIVKVWQLTTEPIIYAAYCLLQVVSDARQ